ncbi:alkaline phosphatase D [Pseudonocardia asaccharolytica DSM 44247 = NBRC 16224]|uniref:Alkaline phosphatase D n=1 Tax=Pseudonocardia asaccharolytica DSM 44247 = NBRC 16224 TaxID=1123024 RepID=A0A511D3E3_9PSEU|nr:alkaline phosphatase D family protein [Pseudonocardia asaccharolytica]GEL19197.1 alkaline phosphatase D [Pseudonocardia asaccharolytica DSM 44247 = NBRC 16224]
MSGALPGCARPRPTDPFTVGVASGEPSASGVVLWTRLAPNPLAEDGFGGMGPGPVEVEWELAVDESFRRVHRRGTETAVRESAHSVHVELEGLAPGREYFYRFRTGSYQSPVGRTRTAPGPGAHAGTLTMCVASCAQYEHGYFTAYRHLAQEHPDLVLHLGDYRYEHAAQDYVAPDGNVRDHAGPETVTLGNYRQRYAQYKTDPDLQAAHAAAPWLAVWDDHELDNNWADEIPEMPQPDFLARRAAAFQAFHENMPLRRISATRGIDLQLYRRVDWGNLASFFLLDTRQYRSDQPCGGRFGSDCPGRTDPSRSITGGEQESWLLDGLRSSSARWNLLGQQVFFTQLDVRPGAGRGFNPDAWDGYVGSRERLVAALRDSRARNSVILTGDMHRHCAAEVKERFDDPASATIAAELVSTSITSEGDGSETEPTTAAILADNPHIRFHHNRRGYLRAAIQDREIRADFRVVPYVSRPGAPVETRASFVIENGQPALHRS